MRLFCLILTLTFFSCGTFQKRHESDICSGRNFYQPVVKASFDNIDQLKKLNGKFVTIEGIFYFNFEDVALYPSKSSSSTTNALWLDLVIPDSLSGKLNKKKVRVIGRVDLARKGHLNGYLATLDSAFCIEEVLQ